ncbi:MAG: photosynthetic complex putative assembly protein PuhB [Paracoccaceae bacterium]
MQHHDDFNFEPVRGLPEALPRGEAIVWQGAPSARRLARDAYKIPWIAGYFALLMVWRFAASVAVVSPAEAAWHAVPFLVAGLATCGIVQLLAWVQARATVYTITTARVAMRIGAALTMTLNLPHVKIAGAGLDLHRDGTGTIAFDLMGDVRFSHLMTWPHLRPWAFPTRPAFRAIPDAAAVAELFAETARARLDRPEVTRDRAAADAVPAE